MSTEKKEDSAPVISTWSGLFKKSISQRQELISTHLKETRRAEAAQESEFVLTNGGLGLETANAMVENCIGVLGMPLGVMPNLVLNGKHYVVPMSIEEPSVIAAASSACKFIANQGGFEGTSSGNVMVGQLQLLDLQEAEGGVEAIRELIVSKRDELIDAANQHCKSMVKRGGGVSDLQARMINPSDDRKPYLIIHIKINVCEAMGANIVNTVVEGLAPHVEDLASTLFISKQDANSPTGPRVGLKILTNLCLERKSCVNFRIPIKNMAWKSFDGDVVSKRVLEAYYLAVDDMFRATTHNKGTMNGIDAVAIATGQDWRAIEAAAHAYASLSGRYQPMTSYAIEDDHFVGRLELPISVGTIGGALQTHPTYKLTHNLLGNPDAQTLCQIILAVGLAQNFAALRALALEGIQKGHMALHARNVAISNGVPLTSLSQCVAYMTKNKQISKTGAEQFLAIAQQRSSM